MIWKDPAEHMHVFCPRLLKKKHTMYDQPTNPPYFWASVLFFFSFQQGDQD